MKNNLRNFLLLILLGTQVISWSQDPNYNSPYSRFGIGDLTNNNLMTTRAMGNMGTSYFNGYSINSVNPASYSFLNLATYDVAINAEYAQVSDSQLTEDRWKGNLDYLAIAFPLRNYKNEILDPTKKKYKLGMAFILKPYSTISYDVLTSEAFENGTILRNFVGNGGTYNLAWGNSIKFNNFSVGANLGFLYGQLSNRQIIEIDNDPSALVESIVNDYNLRGFTYELGLLYDLALNKAAVAADKNIRKKRLTLGLRGHLGTNFSTNGEFSHIGARAVGALRDTIAFNDELTGTGSLPAIVGIGLTYHDGTKFTLGLDAEYGAWSNFTNSIRPDQELVNTFKLGIGGQITPDDRGFGSFLERVSYQFGAYYHQDPRVIESTQIENYGITLGMALPFFYQQKFSKVNISFDLGQRGVGTLISENFIQMGLGLNFNDDSWFIRRKYN